MATAARRKIALHLLVPFIHSLNAKPSGEGNLVALRQTGNGFFNGFDGEMASTVMPLMLAR